MLEKKDLQTKQLENLRVAIVHDFVVAQGGAERVLKVLSQMFPKAPIYTLLYNQEKMGKTFEGKDIRASYLRKLPKFLQINYRWLLPLFPVLPETFDLREFDLVISSSGAWSKGIVTKLNSVHVAYLHSPMRFVWDCNDKYVKEINQRRLSFFARFTLNYLRVWDRLAADRPDFLIANSKYTQQRIAKYYRRESTIIYPPVEIESTISNVETGSEAEKYFLIVSRLSPYKKVDLVVEAFNKLGLPLIVIGTGEQERHLKKIAKPNVKILGWQDDQITQKYYKNALGFIFPAEDDFGITPVEAMSFGVPVLAYRKGGVCETVQEGITGEFFDAQTPEVLADGVRRFMLNKEKYDKEIIQKRAREFSRERFEKDLRKFLHQALTKNN